MKQRTLEWIGIAGTAILMIALAYMVWYYVQNPDDSSGMMGMSMLSSGLMVFLIIFSLLYTRPKPSEEYMEMYQGVCARCGAKFGEDGVCPVCGRVRPSKKG